MRADTWIQTGILLIATITVTYSYIRDRRERRSMYKRDLHQRRIMFFSEYTRRYQDILINMPQNVYVNKERIDERTKTFMRLYFNLCSEEYYLWKNQLISDAIWNMWKAGMEITTKTPIYIRCWIALRGEYNDEFYLFFERDILKLRKTSPQ